MAMIQNNYGFNASRSTPLLFQVEQDLSERLDRAKEEPELIAKMMARLSQFESQVSKEGTFGD
jgi:arylsulfatase A